MNLTYSEICSPGGRTGNQDCAGWKAGGGKACFVVCDGLGAYSGSGIASNICVRSVCDGFMEKGEPTKDSVGELVFEAHCRITEEKTENGYIDGACTTFAGLFTDGTRTVIAHIGDSRVYRFRAGKIRFCTADHSVAQLDVEAGRISRRDLRYHRDQNKLTRVLGGRRYLPPDISELNEPLGPGDAFLLCTDGFWEYVDEDEMEYALTLEGTGERLLEYMENKLRSRAPEGNDNYTAALVRVTEEDER